MNAATDNPMVVGSAELRSLPARPATWARAAMPLVAGVVLLLWTTGSCPAMDQPPQEPEQERAWLVGHLVTDMEALGTFDGNTLAKVPAIVNALTDDQVALLAQYYFLTRSKTEQDASLYAMQQQGYADEQVNEAKADIADLLTEMQNQGDACYSQIQTLGEPVQYLAQICYASVPGWCCGAGCFVPEWYYDNGCYVGPCYNSAYAGAWAAPVCRAYYDHGSRFYSTYHNVADRVYVRRSMNLAHRHADWFRHHSDWRNTLAHDRLLHHSSNGYRSPQPRIAAGGKHHVGVPSQAYDHRSAPLHAGARQHYANSPHVAQHQNFQLHANHASAAYLPKAQHQAAKAHANHASTGQQWKPQHNPAQPQVNHSSAPHPHAAHAGQPKPQSHGPHPQHVGNAQVHAKPDEHGKRH